MLEGGGLREFVISLLKEGTSYDEIAEEIKDRTPYAETDTLKKRANKGKKKGDPDAFIVKDGD